MPYRYRFGDRPLEGYVIKRGIGHGGFGEVYYAESDGGREVALKVIQQHEDIELRGVRQCMNLKSPHLVCIFDIRTSDEGVPFVIMEYVSGPSLREIIRSASGGLGRGQACFLVREIARGLSYLHEQGIVHRDLKPENIFYEDGYVKIGDYGLSKFINVSRQSGQTISVGTVHYMAPEIGSGSYSSGIDIYALGVIFYELLTGSVPFDGDSMGEILMKHLTAEPDLDPIDPSLQPILRRALAKSAGDRQPSAQALVEEILAVPSARREIETCGDGSFLLSMRPETKGVDPAAETLPSPSPSVLASDGKPTTPPTAGATVRGHSRDDDPVPRAGPQPEPKTTDAPAGGKSSAAMPVAPDLNFRGAVGSRRLFRGIMTALAMALALTMLGGDGGLAEFFAYAVAILAGTSAVLLVEGWAVTRFEIDMGIARRLVVLAVAGSTLTVVLQGIQAMLDVFSEYQESLLALFAGLVFIDWSARAREDRADQVSLHDAFFAGLFGFIAAYLTGGDKIFIAGLLAAISLALNAVTGHGGTVGRTEPRSSPHRESHRPFAPPRPVHSGPPPEGSSRFWKRLSWIVVLGALLATFAGALQAGIGVLLLGVIFMIGRDRRPRRGQAHAGWLALGSILMVSSLLLGLVGAVVVSDLGDYLVREHGRVVSSAPLEKLIAFGEHGEYFVLSICFFVPGAICLLLARRWGGTSHVLRGALGWTGFGVHLCLFMDFVGRHKIVVGENGVPRLSGLDRSTLGWSVVLLLVGGIISGVFLAWPGAPVEPAAPPHVPSGEQSKAMPSELSTQRTAQ